MGGNQNGALRKAGTKLMTDIIRCQSSDQAKRRVRISCFRKCVIRMSLYGQFLCVNPDRGKLIPWITINRHGF
jgi:hypothetical protein